MSPVKAISQNCVTCQKAYLRTASQMMGQLPEARVSPSPPFSTTGIDFAGPFTTKRGNPRKPTRLKSYVCIFVCFMTRAVHMELRSDCLQGSPGTLHILPHSIYSDNGTNFVGASCEIADCYDLLASKEFQKMASHLISSRRIRWFLSLARAPHFGGLWGPE